MSESEEARKARLAQALRVNLRRRKAQNREQKADEAHAADHDGTAPSQA